MLTDPSVDALQHVLDINPGAVWVPSRPLVNIDTIASKNRLDKVVAATSPAPASTSTPAGAPKQILSPSATESPTRVQGRTMSLVSVSFSRDTSDTLFAGARVWFTGFKGTTQPWLMAQGDDAPINFICETTGETVVVTVQAVAADGTPADFSSAPTCSVALDGVVSAPPAPTIAQTLVPMPNGFQFSFNFLTGLVADVIDGYRVYKSATNDPATATSFQYIKHTPLDVGAHTVQDQCGAGFTVYYWVSAVNTAGLESTLTPAQTAATTSSGSTSVTVIHRPTTTDTSDYTPGTAAYDGNESSTAAEAQATDSTGKTTVWSGFDAMHGTASAVTLKIASKAQQTGSGVAQSEILYSLDGGTTWTTVYLITGGVAYRIDPVTLLTSQDLTMVKVQASCFTDDGGETISHFVYEIWIEEID